MGEQQFTILADPTEGAALAGILAGLGHGCVCREPDELIEQVRAGRVTALFADAELLATLDIAALKGAIAVQPPWSDLPILLLIDRGGAERFRWLMDQLGQVRLVERPLDLFIIERSVSAALRSRSRQAGARAALEAAERARRDLRELTDTLEARVAERGEELKTAYAARLDAEERYRLATRATQDAIWDLDFARDEVRWTEPASGLFGYGSLTAPTPLAWWEEKIHPDDREAASRSLAAAMAGDASHWSARYRFRKADGGYADVHDRGFIIRDAGGTAVRAVGAMADVTDRLRAEAEQRRLEAELAHVSRLSEMGAMASTLAHELNQPLTAVTNYLRGARRLLTEAGGGPALEAIGHAEEGAQRAGRIVRRLRDLVEKGHVERRRESLPELIEEASVIGFVDEAARGVSHRFAFDPAARWVEADRVQVQQVLINLIRNAVDAMEGERREVTIATTPRGDLVEVSVADTGPGIAPELGEALFSPFAGTKEEGMGIGLSISRTIVEAHGGRIWAEPAPGGGALFRFTLPKARQGVAAD
jgi:two-component system, LuxR family, sensor kinase FixL